MRQWVFGFALLVSCREVSTQEAPEQEECVPQRDVVEPDIHFQAGRSYTFSHESTVPFAGYPLALTTGDFTNDGNLDVIAVLEATVLLVGDGKGSFSEVKKLGQRYRLHPIPGDLNNDANLDLVSHRKNEIVIWLGDGQGNVARPPVIEESNPVDSLTLGDLNEDSILDIAAMLTTKETYRERGSKTYMVGVYLGNGDGTFQQPRYLSAPAGDINIRDANKDGKADIVTSQVLFYGQGEGRFGEATSTKTEVPSKFTPTGDFNGDGLIDKARNGNKGWSLFEPIHQSLKLSFGTQDGTFGEPLEVPVALVEVFSRLTSGDFNKDGCDDLVLGGTETITVLLSQPCKKK